MNTTKCVNVIKEGSLPLPGTGVCACVRVCFATLARVSPRDKKFGEAAAAAR